MWFESVTEFLKSKKDSINLEEIHLVSNKYKHLSTVEECINEYVSKIETGTYV